MKAETLEGSEALLREIENLSIEIVELREQRNKLNLEAKTWLRRGEALVDEAEQLKRELKSLREEVGQLTAAIKGLKTSLEKVRKQMVEKRRVKDEFKVRLRELKAKISIPREEAEKLFKELEWHIQTNPLSIEEERKLVERVKTLEGQLNIHDRIGMLVEQLNNNFQELQALKEEAEKIRGQLAEAYSKLKEKRAAISENAERLEEAERQAREAYQKFTDLKFQADQLHNRIIEALNRQRTLKKGLKEIRCRKEAEVLEGIVKELKEAYKQGRKKKLTLEEFKLLMSNGLI